MISFKALDNGFRYIEVSNTEAEAKISLQGAHLFHYQRHGEEPLLWVSEASSFEYGTAIRGGVPVCWPWFGMSSDPVLPQHGFARTMLWELVEARDLDENSTQITLKLSTSEESHRLWPHAFELQLRFTISDTLQMALTTKNCNERPFELTQALHTYIAVSSIDNVSVEGLHGKPYFDALEKKKHIQDGTVRFSEETDRVYQEVNNPILLIDKERSVVIENSGSSSVVMWNPWRDKSSRMSGMKPDSYKTMLCIESANAMEDLRLLQPGQTHTLQALIH